MVDLFDSRRLSCTARNLCGLLLSLLVCTAARADRIYLKDGFVIQGKVKQDSVLEVDHGTPVVIPKGFIFIDDGARFIVFNQKQVRAVEGKQADRLVSFLNPKPALGFFGVEKFPGLEALVSTSPWNTEKWERSISYRVAGGKIMPLNTRIGYLNPYYFRADATARIRWWGFYLTRELEPGVIRELLATHPDLKVTPDMAADKQAARRFKYCDFFAQAGLYDEAEDELERMLKELPDQKERIEAVRAAMNGLRNRERFEDIKRLHQAGQTERVQRLLAKFPDKEASDKVAADVAEMRSEQNAVKEKLAQANQFLQDLPKLVVNQRREFAAIAAAIKVELGPETLAKLDSFLGQAQQAERKRKAGMTDVVPAEDLLSLAATGWLLGSPSAEAKPERALQLWQARDFVLAYLKENKAAARQKLLTDFQARKNSIQLDEIMQMIPQLPPVEAERKEEKPVERAAGKGLPYELQLPPEYRQSRSYPVLVLLHQEGEKAKDMLERWREAAVDNGYILVAPNWEQGNGYGYTEREHETVLAALRDVRRRFNVDSDRVFLFGLGQGGNMAFDVGLSHPDLFAGVMPMGGTPDLFAERYWRNGQNLPFYVMNGTKAGDGHIKTHNLFNAWVQRGDQFPSLWIQYKGRGAEWFAGEIPNLIDWMRTKKRVFPLQQLGVDGMGSTMGTEFCSMRPSDNHFYWLSTSGILDRCCNSAANWRKNVQASTLTARVDQSSNTIYLKAVGVKQVTVWLGRDAQGKNMVDLDKQLIIRLGLQRTWTGKASPSLATMLEDLYQRGDRQQLFLAKVDLHF